MNLNLKLAALSNQKRKKRKNACFFVKQHADKGIIAAISHVEKRRTKKESQFAILFLYVLYSTSISSYSLVP